jgi:hypothetical protein
MLSRPSHGIALTHVISAGAIASAISLVARAEQIVTIRLTPDPLIEDHIRNIQGPERIMRVSIRQPRGTQSKAQDVSVRGPIEDAHVARLILSAVANTDQYWSPCNAWTIAIVGDGQYAVVRAASVCGFFMRWWGHLHLHL